MLTRVQEDRKENLNAAEENRKKILKDRPVKEVVTSETANQILDSIDLDMFWNGAVFENRPLWFSLVSKGAVCGKYHYILW